MSNIKIFPIEGRKGFVELQQHNFQMRDILEVRYYQHWTPVGFGEIEYIKTNCVAVWKVKWKKMPFRCRIIMFLKQLINWI